MYQIAREIENVISFKVLDKYLAFKLKENKRLLYLNSTIVDEDNRGYLFFQNSLCLHNEAKTTFLNLQTNERTEISIIFNGDSGYFENTYISSINSKQEEDYRWTSNYVMYQINPFKKLYELPHRYYGSGYRFKNQYIQMQNELKLLKSLSLLTGEYDWETPLNRNGEIFKILGVRENELVVCWKRGMDYYGLLGINAQSGQIVWNIDNNLLLNGLSLYFTENQQTLFSTKADGNSSYFIEIDLTTKQTHRYGEIVDLCKNKWAISSSQYKDGLVYFTASTHHFLFPNILGVLDYQRLKLLWYHHFDFDRNTHLKNFEVDGSKLYVLDSADTLHIFERED